MNRPVQCGDIYVTDNEGLRVAIRRVARDHTWADIRVTTPDTGASWTKRQPLQDGRLPYPATDIGELIARGAVPAALDAEHRHRGAERCLSCTSPTPRSTPSQRRSVSTTCPARTGRTSPLRRLIRALDGAGLMDTDAAGRRDGGAADA